MSKVKQEVDPAGQDGLSKRDRILDAAVECVVALGYARTTMSEVARRADVPRPLVQYYFPTIDHLMRAAIEVIYDRWLASYVATLTPDTTISDGVDRLWQSMHEPHFRAYHELLGSSRTDAKLSAVMAQFQRELEEKRRAQSSETYPRYVATDPEGFNQSSAFTRIFLLGLKMYPFGSDAPRQQAEQIRLLKKLLIHFWSAHGLSIEGEDAAEGPLTAKAPEPAPAAALPASSPDLAELAQLARELADRLEGLNKA